MTIKPTHKLALKTAGLVVVAGAVVVSSGHHVLSGVPEKEAQVLADTTTTRRKLRPSRESLPSDSAPTPPDKPPAQVPPPNAPAGGALAAPQAADSAINLANWKITLPVDANGDGKPDEIMQPALANFTLDPYFKPHGGGLLFRAHAGGFTTSNSSYPRSELREMNGKQLAAWSNTKGSHVMVVRQAITHVPSAKPHVVAGQIHDASDDVVMVRLEGSRLFVEGDGDDLGVLDPNYKLGTAFTVKIEASNGRIKVAYNDQPKVDLERNGSSYYFKAGCYTQSNTSRGDRADAYGQVIIYGLSVSHS